MKANIADLPLFKMYLDEKCDLADSTIDGYVKRINQFLAGNPDVDNIEDYNNFLMKVSIKKRNQMCYYALQNFIKFKFTGEVKSTLIDGMLKPKHFGNSVIERKNLTEDEIYKVINNLEKEKHRIVSIIQTLTGVRAGDVLRLKRGNIAPEVYNGKNVLKINITGKGGKRNVVYIHDELMQKGILEYLFKCEGVADYYFLEASKWKGRASNIYQPFKLYEMNYGWYLEDLKRALIKSGIKPESFSTHDYRRCFARKVWEKWKDIQVLQNLLNHTRIETTMIYLKHSGLKNIDYLEELQK